MIVDLRGMEALPRQTGRTTRGLNELAIALRPNSTILVIAKTLHDAHAMRGRMLGMMEAHGKRGCEAIPCRDGGDTWRGVRVDGIFVDHTCLKAPPVGALRCEPS